MLIKPNISQIAKIKVVGVGGAGCNAINSMIEVSQIKGVEFLAVNTDAQALLTCQANNKVQIGENLTKGLGSGGVPEIGRQAAEESKEKLDEYLNETDMVFITAGMGGGTGTGASPVIAEMAKQKGILTVAVVTRPFFFEGTKRANNADEGVANLRDKVDTLIIIPNQKLLESIDKKLTLIEAFKLADGVLSQGVQGISDIITTPGLINVDFADVKSVMKDSGSALMGIGLASGEGRAAKAAREAISSPLLEVSIEGAKGVLFNITGSEELLMTEIDEAAKIITSAVDKDANIIFGTTIDKNLKEEIKITVIATGFDESKQAIQRLNKQFQTQRSKATPASSYFQFQKMMPEEPVLTSSAAVEEEIPLPEEEKKPLIEDNKPAIELKSADFEKDVEAKTGAEDVFEIPAFLRQKDN